MILKLSLMRWCATLVGVQLLCGIAWVLGPLLPPLEPAPARLAVVLALLLAWAAWNLLLDWRRARRDTALAEGVVGAGAEEAAAVRARLETALDRMRQANSGRGYLYEQPWYAIIGPPGAGKTTALLNAGLVFPLSDDLGPGAVAGVGGTRLCDWWFTEDAVLIDTAGRYTTQDSDRDVDRAGWEAFLAVLHRTRPRQPLNGVIVAIALIDVTGDQPGLCDAHANAIRERIEELETRLRVRLPVYALFTKADLLIGFTEFFDDLGRAGREQVWGATLPLTGPVDVVSALRPLLDRLSRRVFQRLDQEASPDRRALIAGFPAQVASMMPPLQAFVAAAFGPTATGGGAWLRGVYMASGTQEGTPIDRLVGGLARSFGVDQRRAPRARPEAGRSYFLADLLRDVVFREAMLIAHRPAERRRRTVVRVAGFAACLLAALLGSGVLLRQRAATLQAVEHASTAASAAASDEIPLASVADADFARLLPWLDALRPGPGAADRTRGLIGFSQNAKLAAAGEVRYRHALAFALFPRLIWRLETRMRGAKGQPDALFEATRIYLMLGGAGPLDRALVAEWFDRDWGASLPAESMRASLRMHLAALLGEPLPPIVLDGPLVRQSRAIIAEVPLARRAYSRLKPLLAGKLPPWRPADALGPVGTHLFLRLSGRGLDEGVPGAYTLTEFRDVVLPGLARAAQQAIGESWVLGEAVMPDSATLRTLQADIAALYAAEYIAAWDAMLADLDPAPMRSLTQAAQDLFILASAHSPIRSVLTSAVAQLTPAAIVPAGPVAAAIGAIDRHYEPLRTLFAASGTASIDQVFRPLGDLQQQLAKQAASAIRLPAPAPAEDPAVALRAEALRQPQPLARWLHALATSGAALRDGGPRGVIIVAWNASGGPGALCQSAIADRYPFVPTAASDISIDDFARLFGPGGMIDAFFNTQLKPYVDTGVRPWRLRAVDGVNAPLAPADLAQFQRAAAIRDLFFPAGSARPQVRFDVTPGPLDPGAVSVTFEMEGITVSAMRGMPPRPAALSWPGRERDPPARVTIAAAPPAMPSTIEADGPWAPFRLISRARAATSGDRMSLAFIGNDRTARFELRASPNPFSSTLLSEFRCPAVQ